MAPRKKHEYASDVLDAGALARFGRIEIEPGSSGYEILTRTGNVEQPVRGWTDWQPLKDGVTVSPAAGDLQWKAELHPGGNIGGVGVNYLPVNAAPVVDELVVATGARINPQLQAAAQPTTVNIAFPSATQSQMPLQPTPPTPRRSPQTKIAPYNSALGCPRPEWRRSSLLLYIRGDGETSWRLLKDKITDKAYSFDAALVPDGGYQVKVVATDAPSHTPGDASPQRKSAIVSKWTRRPRKL